MPFEDLWHIFEIEDHSRILGRSSRSKIVQEPSQDFPVQVSIMDLRKMFAVEDRLRIYETTSR